MFNRKLKGFPFPFFAIVDTTYNLPSNTIIYPVVKLSGGSFRSMGKLRSPAVSVWYNCKLTILTIEKGILFFELNVMIDLIIRPGRRQFLIIIITLPLTHSMKNELEFIQEIAVHHNTTSGGRCWKFTIGLWIVIIAIDLITAIITMTTVIIQKWFQPNLSVWANSSTKSLRR